jgi:hypothetical protein
MGYGVASVGVVNVRVESADRAYSQGLTACSEPLATLLSSCYFAWLPLRAYFRIVRSGTIFGGRD